MAGAWSVVMVLLAAPVVAAWWVLGRAESRVAEADPVVFVAVSSAGDSLEQVAVVVPTWERQVPVVAPAWTGLVQQVLVSPGDVVTTGTRVALVDGVARLAARTTVPISRPLQRTNAGPDVAALHDLLGRLGYETSPADVFGSTTAASVKLLAAELGAGTTEVLDPGWLLYLPFEGDAVVASVDLAVAQPVPAPGAVVVEVAPRLVGARVVPPLALPADDGGVEPAPEPGVVPAPVVIDEAGTFTDLSPASQVTVGDAVLAPVAPDGVLGADALITLVGLVEAGQPTVAATLQEPLPDRTARVPAAATVTGPTGSTCVAVRAVVGTGTAVDLEPVVVLDSALGVATVTGVDPGVEVQVAPAASVRAACR